MARSNSEVGRQSPLYKLKKRVTELRYLLRMICLTALAACSSTHNFKTDGNNALGGGFYDENISSGLYKLSASGNMAPWPNFGAAKETWRRRADQLCGTNKYQEIVTSENAGYQGKNPVYLRPGFMPEMPRYNSIISGYILCDSSEMTVSDAVSYLNDLETEKRRKSLESQKQALSNTGGEDCNDGHLNFTPEALFQRGKILTALNQHKSALACFMKAQELAGDSATYQESCIAIGTMFELGWGVEKDLPTAKDWFRKGGL